MQRHWTLGLFYSVLFLTFPHFTNADVKISNLDDINFGIYSAFGNLRDNDNICINAIPLSEYQVTIWGSGAAGAYEVTNGIDTIPFVVRYRHRTGQGGKKMTPGVPLTGRRRADDVLDCPSGLNASIDVQFKQAQLQAANPGRYNGQLTVTIVPE